MARTSERPPKPPSARSRARKSPACGLRALQLLGRRPLQQGVDHPVDLASRPSSRSTPGLSVALTFELLADRVPVRRRRRGWRGSSRRPVDDRRALLEPLSTLATSSEAPIPVTARRARLGPVYAPGARGPASSPCRAVKRVDQVLGAAQRRARRDVSEVRSSPARGPAPA